MAVEPMRLDLEIDPGSEPITGRIGRCGERRPFVGWAGLAGLLTDILDAVDSDIEESPREPHADRT